MGRATSDLKKRNFTTVELPKNRYKDKTEQRLFFDKFKAQLVQNNEVSDVAIRFDLKKQPIAIDGVQYLKTQDKPQMQVFGFIGDTGFMGLNLRAGRVFDLADITGAAKDVLISESMAQRYWPASSALGNRIEVKLGEQISWFTIVGVVSNIPNNAFSKPAFEDEIYVSGYHYPNQSATVFFKSTNNTEAVEDTFFRAMNG
jgi:hypothetical protein